MRSDLAALLEAHLSSLLAPPAQRKQALAALTSHMRLLLPEGAHAEVAEALARAVGPDLDFSALQSLHRLYARLPVRENRLRVAVLSSFTTDQLVQFLELFLHARGLSAEIYSAPYGTWRQEILDPASGLYRFAPSLMFVATTWRDLAHRPELGDPRERVAGCVAEELEDWAALWRTAHERLGCQILQNNFETPAWGALANHEPRHPASLGSYLARVNLAFADGAPAFVTLHDVDALSASWGRASWGDPRYFHLAKLPCAPEQLVDYAHSAASVIAALLGKTRKCLVLDLDNTLWGGVVGDDGIEGLRLGQGDGEGEAFCAFQAHVRALRGRGVLLAVCSKNDDAVARDAFQNHPGMVLRLDDIACFVANWNDKPANLRRIAERLNIGTDALVFVDDNPAERAIVRQVLPEVVVPEIPTDPDGYIPALERGRHFQMTSLSTEDLRRTDYYRADLERKEGASASGGTEEFLRSLRMSARVEPIRKANLERSVQLINKSNQYNLTTRRYTVADVEALTASGEWVSRTVTLVDRFGDNGLISVVLAKAEGTTLRIDTWLMSCRVLSRTVEHLLLNQLAAIAVERGLTSIAGEFIPSGRNGLVTDHYARLGFQQLRSEPDGHTWWVKQVPPLEPWVTFIVVGSAP